MKKKINIIQILRMIVQIGFLVILPGLFMQVFGEMKMVVTSLVDGSFNFIEMLPSMLELIIVIPLTVIVGRFFCGWMCAFGTYNEIVYKVFQKLTGKKIKISEGLDNWLKSIKYIVLAGIVVGIWMLGFKAPVGASPWDAFGMIKEIPAAFQSLMIGFGVLALITIGAAVSERFFCRYLCPLGITFGIFSKLKVVSLNKPSEECGSCKVCTNNCPMGIDMYKEEKVRSVECINCLKCVEKCPRKNVKVNIFGAKIKTRLASAAAIIAFIGLYLASAVMADTVIAMNPVIPPNSDAKATPNSDANATKATTSKYNNGTYSGTGAGFRPGTVVSVTVENDKIIGISLVSTKDDTTFCKRAYNPVKSRIISAQKTSVATISGATFSSNGMIKAVDNALNKAKM